MVPRKHHKTKMGTTITNPFFLVVARCESSFVFEISFNLHLCAGCCRFLSLFFFFLFYNLNHLNHSFQCSFAWHNHTNDDMSSPVWQLTMRRTRHRREKKNNAFPETKQQEKQNSVDCSKEFVSRSVSHTFAMTRKKKIIIKESNKRKTLLICKYRANFQWIP